MSGDEAAVHDIGGEDEPGEVEQWYRQTHAVREDIDTPARVAAMVEGDLAFARAIDERLARQRAALEAAGERYEEEVLGRLKLANDILAPPCGELGAEAAYALTERAQRAVSDILAELRAALAEVNAALKEMKSSQV